MCGHYIRFPQRVVLLVIFIAPSNQIKPKLRRFCVFMESVLVLSVGTEGAVCEPLNYLYVNEDWI